MKEKHIFVMLTSSFSSDSVLSFRVKGFRVEGVQDKIRRTGSQTNFRSQREYIPNYFPSIRNHLSDYGSD